MEIQYWETPSNEINEEYVGNKKLAIEISSKGYKSIINEYTYIDSPEIQKTFDLIPNLDNSINGIGVDLGGGVGCISSTLALKKSVQQIYCVELVKEVVELCQPIVKEKILGDKMSKVVSVVGNFDILKLDSNSIDFVVAWDSIHHSNDPVKTLVECKRILKKNHKMIIVDRAHNNSTSDSEIERMLNITYDVEFLKKNYRPIDQKLTRRENGEHEYRFSEWESFFKKSGFELLVGVIIKTKNKENLNLKNDNNYKEIFVDYDLGAFGNRKVVYVISPKNK